MLYAGINYIKTPASFKVKTRKVAQFTGRLFPKGQLPPFIVPKRAFINSEDEQEDFCGEVMTVVKRHDTDELHKSFVQIMVPVSPFFYSLSSAFTCNYSLGFVAKTSTLNEFLMIQCFCCKMLLFHRLSR